MSATSPLPDLWNADPSDTDPPARDDGVTVYRIEFSGGGFPHEFVAFAREQTLSAVTGLPTEVLSSPFFGHSFDEARSAARAYAAAVADGGVDG